MAGLPVLHEQAWASLSEASKLLERAEFDYKNLTSFQETMMQLGMSMAHSQIAIAKALLSQGAE